MPYLCPRPFTGCFSHMPDLVRFCFPLHATSSEAQQPNLLEACYDVQRVQKLLAKQREAEAEALASEQRAAGERALSHD